MTFTIAKNQIHIGWPQTVAVLSFIIAGVWSARAKYDEYIQETQKINATLVAIQREFANNRSTNSIQTENISKLFYRLDSLIAFDHHPAAGRFKKAGVRFYTERWVNGHLQLTEVKQD